MIDSETLLRAVMDAGTHARPIDDLHGWWSNHMSCASAYADTIDRALVAGARADRIGYAFASGYQCALASLFGAEGPSSMLVTEEAGGHPRAMRTTLTSEGDRIVVSGEKRFATLGTFAHTLYVLAKEGERDGLPMLRVVRVARASAGVALADMKATPFCPEIPHATASLTDVRVRASDVLPGDGYLRYVRPFRTVEDLHVFGAVLGHALGVAARVGAPSPLVEELAALVVTMRAVAALDRDAPTTSLALEGALVLMREVLAGMPDALRDHEDARARWARDAGLFRVAESARAARLAKARAMLGL